MVILLKFEYIWGCRELSSLQHFSEVFQSTNSFSYRYRYLSLAPRSRRFINSIPYYLCKFHDRFVSTSMLSHDKEFFSSPQKVPMRRLISINLVNHAAYFLFFAIKQNSVIQVTHIASKVFPNVNLEVGKFVTHKFIIVSDQFSLKLFEVFPPRACHLIIPINLWTRSSAKLLNSWWDNPRRIRPSARWHINHRRITCTRSIWRKNCV